jgi:prephenate dehydratase
VRVGYQGEPYSYSHRATTELFVAGEPVGLPTFVACFAALESGDVERLVLPVENSTTGSVLPVLDRLPGNAEHRPISIIAEHLVEVRHALLALPRATPGTLKSVKSHPQALAQAEGRLLELGLEEVPRPDTAGAVREVAADGDMTVAALAPPEAGPPHGLQVVLADVLDRDHNTTRFVVLRVGEPTIDADHDKTTVLFTTEHRAGALALALTELGLRGANLTRIESRPANEAWSYHFFVDLEHSPGPSGLRRVLEPDLATLKHLRVLGSYKAVG